MLTVRGVLIDLEVNIALRLLDGLPQRLKKRSSEAIKENLHLVFAKRRSACDSEMGLTATALSPADDSGMSSGEAKEPEDPSAFVDTHPGLVDGHGLIFLHTPW